MTRKHFPCQYLLKKKKKGCVCVWYTYTYTHAHAHKHDMQVCKSLPHNTRAVIRADMETVSREQQKGSFSSVPPECAPVQAISGIWDGGQGNPHESDTARCATFCFFQKTLIWFGCWRRSSQRLWDVANTLIILQSPGNAALSHMTSKV